MRVIPGVCLIHGTDVINGTTQLVLIYRDINYNYERRLKYENLDNKAGKEELGPISPSSRIQGPLHIFTRRRTPNLDDGGKKNTHSHGDQSRSIPSGSTGDNRDCLSGFGDRRRVGGNLITRVVGGLVSGSGVVGRRNAA